jgi:light-regulated signal transduction histidine kinase (bacteriophytochrome)
MVAAPIMRENTVQGAVMGFQDIRQRREAREALEIYAESLARSNKELENFASVASHDLQEPLRKIGSFTELLARKYKGQMDEKADTYIGFIVDGARRMQILINDLLTFSRVTSQGKEFVAVDCNAVFSQVKRDLELAIIESGARLSVSELPTVMADEVQLAQVFSNLVGNALKYRTPNVAPEIAVAAEKRQGDWRFSVRDNGLGIAPQYFERIFQIFQRLHPREEYSGTGIGLAICKKIVERHGGKIWLESTPGQGSTIFFTLPWD